MWITFEHILKHFWVVLCYLLLNRDREWIFNAQSTIMVMWCWNSCHTFCAQFICSDIKWCFAMFVYWWILLFQDIWQEENQWGKDFDHNIYEPVTKGRDLKWDTLPQNQTPSKLFSVLPLESGMFQVTISIIKKWFWSKCVLYGIKTGVRSGVDVCNNGHSECHNNTEKNHLYAILMLLVHLSSC